MRTLRPFLAVIALGALAACTTVSQVNEPMDIPTTGEATKERQEKALAYSVAIPIDATPEVVWSVLSDGESFANWNSTVQSFDGEIALGETVELVSTLDPERTFKLKVTELVPNERLVWEDGMPMGMFKGVRTYTLYPRDGMTIFTMEEVLSGGMLGSIEDSLPDFRPSFQTFAADLKAEVESRSN